MVDQLVEAVGGQIDLGLPPVLLGIEPEFQGSAARLITDPIQFLGLAGQIQAAFQLVGLLPILLLTSRNRERKLANRFGGQARPDLNVIAKAGQAFHQLAF